MLIKLKVTGVIVKCCDVYNCLPGVFYSQWHRYEDAAAVRRSSQEALPAWSECRIQHLAATESLPCPNPPCTGEHACSVKQTLPVSVTLLHLIQSCLHADPEPAAGSHLPLRLLPRKTAKVYYHGLRFVNLGFIMSSFFLINSEHCSFSLQNQNL